MLEKVITYSAVNRQSLRGVRRTKSGRFLVLAEPAGNAKIRINFKPILRQGDGINSIAADAESITWSAQAGGDSLDVTLSSIPYTSGSYRDYGRYGDADDPNFYLKVTFVSGNIVIVPIVARNYNLPLEISPQTIATAETLRAWAVISPLVGSDVAFDPTAVDDSVREILFRPMELQPLVNSDGANSPDSIHINTAAFTYEEEDIPAASGDAETPSSSFFISEVGSDVAVTGS